MSAPWSSLRHMCIPCLTSLVAAASRQHRGVSLPKPSRRGCTCRVVSQMAPDNLTAAMKVGTSQYRLTSLSASFSSIHHTTYSRVSSASSHVPGHHFFTVYVASRCSPSFDTSNLWVLPRRIDPLVLSRHAFFCQPNRCYPGPLATPAPV